MISQELIQILKSANHIAALTGAGVSKESGIPTFREAQTGLWAKYDPADLATPEAYMQNPEMVWTWYESRREIVRQKQPNSGHIALVEIERHIPEFTLITQNVDGYHRQAGSDNVIELHGNIMRTKRFGDGVVVDNWVESDEVPPHCPDTGQMLRPDVVWFGEMLPDGLLERAIDAAKQADVFLSIGTSGLVQPAASLALYAKRAGAVLIEVNPAETPLTPLADYVLSGASGEVLPDLVNTVWGT